MNTKELAERFDIEHKQILSYIERLQDMFGDAQVYNQTYVSEQNKVLPAYELSNEAVIYLLTSKRMFRNSPDRLKTCSDILYDLGAEHTIVLGEATRKEAIFYDMLVDFFPDLTILSQFPVNRYLIDFYLPEYNIAVEYDETHHKSDTQTDKDLARMKDIDSYLKNVSDDEQASVTWVRVNEGEEVKGLRLVLDTLHIESLGMYPRN